MACMSYLRHLFPLQIEENILCLLQDFTIQSHKPPENYLYVWYEVGVMFIACIWTFNWPSTIYWKDSFSSALYYTYAIIQATLYACSTYSIGNLIV